MYIVLENKFNEIKMKNIFLIVIGNTHKLLIIIYL